MEWKDELRYLNEAVAKWQRIVDGKGYDEMACGLCHLALLKQLDDVEYTGKCTPKYCPLKAYDHVHGCVETIPCTGEYRAYRNNMTKTNAIACLKKAKAVRDWRIATHIYREG